jgi:RNA polymerase sigma-70 factor (ECF subfamily)
MNDHDVFLLAIQSRDANAFGRWMAEAEAPIRASLRTFATVVDVEAVLQEALLRVWQVAPRFVPDGAPNGLLRLGVRIGRNLAVSEVRRTRARPAEEGELERALAEASPEASGPAAPDPFLRARIAACRDKLPDKPRQALDARLASEGGTSDADLAEALAMRANTFLQNFTRARRLLAECLRRYGITIDPELEA